MLPSRTRWKDPRLSSAMPSSVENPVTTATVSVIIPCHQHGRWLGEAAESALAQRGGELEVVIVDDGSTDNTREVAGALARRHPGRVKYFHQHNQGQHVARQRGLEAATGEYCLTLDADDLLEPGAVETCLRVFADNPGADAVVGDALIVAADGRTALRRHMQRSVAAWPEVLARNPYGVNLGVMARTAALRAAGGLALGSPGCEDWDVWRRMTRCGMRFVPVAAVLGRYRQTGQNHTRNALGNLKAYVEMLDRATGDEPALAQSGRAVAPPLSRELYAQYRNGRVFHALGLALGYGAEKGAWEAIAGLTCAGGLDAALCLAQFGEGLRFARSAAGGAEWTAPPGELLDLVARRLRECGQAGAVETLRGGMIREACAAPGRRSLRSIAGRLREKIRRILSPGL